MYCTVAVNSLFQIIIHVIRLLFTVDTDIKRRKTIIISQMHYQNGYK